MFAPSALYVVYDDETCDAVARVAASAIAAGRGGTRRDDDEEEVAAAKAAGIKANLVPSALEEGAIAKWWANKLHEAGFEVAPRLKKYLKMESAHSAGEKS